MTDAVETMAWTGEKPWHGLGFEVSNKLTPAQMLKAAKLDWGVAKKPLFYEKKGVMTKVPERFGLVRDSDESCLSIVGPTYKPVQNEVAFDFFKKFVASGKMTMETAGSLWDGRYVWALAKIGKGFTLGKEDRVEGYLLLASPHVRGKAMLMLYTAVRVVCWNTLSAAIGAEWDNLKGGRKNRDSSAPVFRMPHTMEFNDTVKKQAEIALGLSTKQTETLEEAVTLLSKKKAKPEQVKEFFFTVLEFNPEEAKKNKDGSVREPRMLPQFFDALEHAPGAQMAPALGTWWGAVNAVTAVVDHQAGRERSTALKSAWVGSNASLKRRALNVALDMAK